mmetsp:Transcript_42721/g.93216  ORF Transcript_42721/g.93216 Transcript_42721/m.93216 type:complete len:522 (+) Transcript_42721:69-1634(+)|eukprot:CAMPEP_0204258626 /NCGR_PEP_ID=MMETSP0468-20130131/5078_1 /ASSEMBLY_ACC=CAM_ASM_000383 /TAXON_ID=2969 /ORGANISM="Oxyrrhis marina" /LENGTH=521 /DNA_ID=CAMNT_0051232817 /DNA_START=14 /DNA_END=1579 /DNA_ORIENTATION=-
MRLDANGLRYLQKEDFRVLTAIEMGMKNHELVPVPLIESIANQKRGNTFKILATLGKLKLIHRDRSKYEGYKLTYLGYDWLALRSLVNAGHITGVGTRMGVGKEADVHTAEGPDGKVYALKLHRLGRVSFRTIKLNRDYLKHRQSASWMYMARLAAQKEYAYLKSLYEQGYPVPTPVDCNRHAVLMDFVPATPMYRMHRLKEPHKVLERLMRLIVKFARGGVIHGDFNEFNLMIHDDEKVTVIDFPQIMKIEHENAEMYFDRDVDCVKRFFRKRFDIHVETAPTFTEVYADYKLIEQREIERRGGGEGFDMPARPTRIAPPVEGTVPREFDEDMPIGVVRVGGVAAKDEALLEAAFEETRAAGPEKGFIEGQEDDDDENQEAEGSEDEARPEVPLTADEVRRGMQTVQLADGASGEIDVAEIDLPDPSEDTESLPTIPAGEGEVGASDNTDSSNDSGDDAAPAGRVGIEIKRKRREKRPVTAEMARQKVKQRATHTRRKNDMKNREKRRQKHEASDAIAGW